MVGQIAGLIVGLCAGDIVKVVLKQATTPKNITTIGKVAYKVGLIGVGLAVGDAVGDSVEKLIKEGKTMVTSIKDGLNKEEDTDSEEEA